MEIVNNIMGALLMSTLARLARQPGLVHGKEILPGKLGRPAVELYVLTNENGRGLAITNYGGAVVSLKVPDRSGKLADIVLGMTAPMGT